MNKETYDLALKKLLSVLQNRSRSSYIAAAIALITVQQVYSFLRVPRSLRGFPVVPILSITRAYLDNLSPVDRFKRIVFPVIENENGLYVVSLNDCIDNKNSNLKYIEQNTIWMETLYC